MDRSRRNLLDLGQRRWSRGWHAFGRATSTQPSSGAVVGAALDVVPGERLAVAVGGHGGDSQASGPGAGGVNGGAPGGWGYNGPGSGGGGASDVRRGDDLSGRIVVAGGGGGHSGGVAPFGRGGDGGHVGEPGERGTPLGVPGGGGGGQDAGGAPGDSGGPQGVAWPTAQPGTLGAGGAGSGGPARSLPPSGENAYGGGGGGGGLFGGGGGAAYWLLDDGGNAAGGGGGSSLVPAGGTVTDGANEGDGRVTITYDPAAQRPDCGLAPPAPRARGSGRSASHPRLHRLNRPGSAARPAVP